MRDNQEAAFYLHKLECAARRLVHMEDKLSEANQAIDEAQQETVLIQAKYDIAKTMIEQQAKTIESLRETKEFIAHLIDAKNGRLREEIITHPNDADLGAFVRAKYLRVEIRERD